MALAMRSKMSELQTVWAESGIEEPLKCRMGINTGMCTVGNFGSDDRMDYTIIGGGVNLAARLESSCKIEEILISYETYSHVKDEVYCEKYGNLEVKGITKPVATYQVIDLHENLSKDVQPIHVKSPHFQLDIDFTSMSLQEQRDAITALRKTAELLSPSKVVKP